MERRNNMKKKLLPFLGIACFALMIGVSGCNDKSGQSQSGGDTQPIQKTYTVAFEVDGARYLTLKVKDGEHIPADQVGTPTKEGFKFVGWYEGTTLVDLAEYVVTKNVTLTAHFEEDSGPQLSVDDVKEQGKTYYLVMGWWETTAMEDDGVTPKVTSHMTRPTVRLFYGNLIKYLKATGATDDNIANIQFRNYSSDTVANMGAAINADGDVDIMIGVGNNINSAAGVALYNSSNDYKFQTPMGEGPTQRYVACTSVATTLGVSTYDWLKGTDAGKAAFVRELTDAEIEASLVPEEINLAVTVHGDTDVTTTLTDKNTAITMPTITVAEGKQFEGFATTQNAEEAQLKVAKNATLKYDDVKDLVAEGANTLDLYPVIKDAPVVEEDLIVYVQVQGSNLRLGEAKLLEARYKAAHADKNIKFNLCEVSSGSEFTTAIGDNPVDVIIGGNSPVDGYPKDDLGPTANVGAKHFQSANRKVIISSKVAAGHKTLAKDLYDFVKAEAPVFKMNVAFWQKADKSWVSDTEMAAMTAGMEGQLKTFLNLGETDALLEKYNVSYSQESITTNTEAGKDKVADLAAATQAAFSGAGAGLIIGCGGNIDQQTGYVDIPKKTISNDVHTFVTATGRYVALPIDNCLTRAIFDNYFVLPTA